MYNMERRRTSWKKQILLVFTTALLHTSQSSSQFPPRCGDPVEGRPASAKSLKYVMGDALVDRQDCVGPEGVPYPSSEIADLLPKLRALADNDLSTFQQFPRSRAGRAMDMGTAHQSESPLVVKENLLKVYGNRKVVKGLKETVEEKQRVSREKREAADASSTSDATATADTTSTSDSDDSSSEDEKEAASCPSATPSRLCKTSFNTTAPMYGVSLTTGGVVTIVQKFPDLLQQVIFETCDKSQCDLIHGECVQTYTPYLFLVIPLGPVTLTGQDYVMVESGCTCRPKYSTDTAPNPLDVIPKFKA